MALKAYLKIGKLAGESAKKPRADAGFCDLISVSLGGTCNWDFSQENAPTKVTTFSGVSCTKFINGSSPILLIGMLKEKKAETVEIMVENDQGGDYFHIKLSGEVRITSDTLSFNNSDMTESITFVSKVMELNHIGKNKKDDINWNDIQQKGATI
jgi:type VI protein secretion system component Hcp